MRINARGLALLKEFEGLKLTAYKDIVGVPTIGYGSTDGITEQDVINKKTITKSEAEDLLLDDLERFEHGVSKCVTVQLNENEFSALVTFSYNLGMGSLQKSTLLKLLNAGDKSGASQEFLKWNKAGGHEVAGLTRRRTAEQKLFLTSTQDEVQLSNNLLPDGPSDAEMNAKLEEIEKEIKS